MNEKETTCLSDRPEDNKERKNEIITIIIGSIPPPLQCRRDFGRDRQSLMESTINCFIPYAGVAQAEKTVQGLQATDLVKKIYLLATSPDIDPLPGCELLYVDKLTDSAAMYAIDEPVCYTHLRAHETGRNIVCRLLLEKKKNKTDNCCWDNR